MRPRTEIENDGKKRELLILEVLLDIRDIISKKEKVTRKPRTTKPKRKIRIKKEV